MSEFKPKKDIEIFNQRELTLLYAHKPELRPKRVPSINEAKTIRVPSINEANILNQPTLDQIIVKFLKLYEVDVKPRSVGEWNGWDTVSTISSFFSSREGNMSNIASTMFYANRSNQINSAAQDWGNWKRWVFDTKEKEFEEFKNKLIQSINSHNDNAIKKIEEEIRQAELYNKNAVEETKKLIRKVELHNENLCKKLQDPKIKEYVSQLIKRDDLQREKNRKQTIKILKIFCLSFFFNCIICHVF